MVKSQSRILAYSREYEWTYCYTQPQRHISQTWHWAKEVRIHKKVRTICFCSYKKYRNKQLSPGVQSQNGYLWEGQNHKGHSRGWLYLLIWVLVSCVCSVCGQILSWTYGNKLRSPKWEQTDCLFRNCKKVSHYSCAFGREELKGRKAVGKLCGEEREASSVCLGPWRGVWLEEGHLCDWLGSIFGFLWLGPSWKKGRSGWRLGGSWQTLTSSLF